MTKSGRPGRAHRLRVAHPFAMMRPVSHPGRDLTDCQVLDYRLQ